MPKTKSPAPAAPTKHIVPYNNFGVRRAPPPPLWVRVPTRSAPRGVAVRLHKNTHRYVVCYAFFCKLVVKSMNARNYRKYHTFRTPTHLYTTYIMYLYMLVLCVPDLKKHVCGQYMRGKLKT